MPPNTLSSLSRRGHARVIALRSGGQSIAGTAKLAGCSASQVKRIWVEVSKAEAARMGAFTEGALTGADAMAAGDPDTKGEN